MPALALCVSAAPTSAPSANSVQPGVIVNLWPAGKMPGRGADQAELAKGPKDDKDGVITNVSCPTLTFFPAPPHVGRAPTAIISPGGSYKAVAVHKEGSEIAGWLNTLGMNAIVLKYRVPKNRDGALQDIQRAIRFARAHAAEWNIDTGHLGVVGFSAGGHLSALASTEFEPSSYPSIDEVDHESRRPDFTILVYPAYLDIDGKVAPEFHLTKQMPPVLILHSEDDLKYVAGSKLLHAVLDAAGIKNRLVMYPTGGHGYGLRCEKEARAWPQQAEAWLREVGVLR